MVCGVLRTVFKFRCSKSQDVRPKDFSPFSDDVRNDLPVDDAAIAPDRLAVDVARPITIEVDEDVGLLLRPGHPPERLEGVEDPVAARAP